MHFLVGRHNDCLVRSRKDDAEAEAVGRQARVKLDRQRGPVEGALEAGPIVPAKPADAVPFPVPILVPKQVKGPLFGASLGEKTDSPEDGETASGRNSGNGDWVCAS